MIGSIPVQRFVSPYIPTMKGKTMSERDDQMLRDHVTRTAESIEAEAKALTLLREHGGETREDLEADAETRGRSETDALIDAITVAREVLELDAVETSDDVAEGLDDHPGLFGDALEVRVQGYRNASDSEWTAETVRVCVGLGGPNLFVMWDGERAHIDGYWGGSRVEGYPISSDASGLIGSELDVWMEDQG